MDDLEAIVYKFVLLDSIRRNKTHSLLDQNVTMFSCVVVIILPSLETSMELGIVGNSRLLIS